MAVAIALGWTALAAFCWTTHSCAGQDYGPGTSYVLHMLSHHAPAVIAEAFRNVFGPVFLATLLGGLGVGLWARLRKDERSPNQPSQPIAGKPGSG